jgi:hypothetical protein
MRQMQSLLKHNSSKKHWDLHQALEVNNKNTRSPFDLILKNRNFKNGKPDQLLVK